MSYKQSDASSRNCDGKFGNIAFVIKNMSLRSRDDL